MQISFYCSLLCSCRFSDVMGPFYQDVKEKCDILRAMAKKMEEAYQELSEFFVLDQKYKLEEFMTDIATFKENFKVRERTSQINYSFLLIETSTLH